MSTVETEGVILRAYRLSEADKIVVALTRKEGVIRGVAHGARRLKSRFGASLEPFTHVSLSLFVKEGRELLTVKNAEIIKSYFTLSRQPEAVAVLDRLSQLIVEFAPPHQPEEKLYRLILACLDAVGEDIEQAEAISPYFELWMLKLNGFLPDLRVCRGCGREFEIGSESVSMWPEGSLSCVSCAGGMPLFPDRIIHQQIALMSQLKPSAWARRFRLLSTPQQKGLARLVGQLTLRALEKQPGARKVYAATGFEE
jgi:DNA repair protein RecO (recombination protein O)